MNWKDELKLLVKKAQKGELPPTEFHVDDQFEDTRLYFDVAPISREDMDRFLQTVKDILK